jgi:hypothetical protein
VAELLLISSSSAKAVIVMDPSDKLPYCTVPENVPFTALEIEPLAIDIVPSVNVPSKVNPFIVIVWFPMSTLFATVKLVIASTVPAFISGAVSVLFVKVSVVALPIKVSVASGKVNVRSALGFPGVSVSSFASADEPSNIKSVVMVEFIARVSLAALPMVELPVLTKLSKVAVPVPVRFLNPVISLFESTMTALLAETVPAATLVLLARSMALSISAPVWSEL